MRYDAPLSHVVSMPERLAVVSAALHWLSMHVVSSACTSGFEHWQATSVLWEGWGEWGPGSGMVGVRGT
jgi:hypothetical protein